MSYSYRRPHRMPLLSAKNRGYSSHGHAAFLFNNLGNEGGACTKMFPQNITNERCSDFSPATLVLSVGVSMPIPVIGLHNKDKVFVNGSCVLNEERFVLIGSFVAFFIPLVIMVVTYCLTIQVGLFFVFVRLLFFATCICCNVFTSSMSPPLQVLQRQATVFLYEAKTSSQQPLHPPAMGNTLQPPPSTFHLPQINTLAPPDSQGKHLPGLYCTCMSAGKSPTNLTNEFMVNT